MSVASFSLASLVAAGPVSVLSAAPALPVVSAGWVLPAALASLPVVSFSGVVAVLAVVHVAGGVDVVCSDGRTRSCRWATVSRFRGGSSAAGAAAFFSGVGVVGRSFRFVACGVDYSGVPWSPSRWFVAVVAA